MILQRCGSCSRYKFVAIYILYAVCLQTSISVFVIRKDLVQKQRVKCEV